MKKTCGLLILFALLSLNALADVPPPKKPVEAEARMAIYLVDDAKEPKIVMSRQMLEHLLEAGGAEGATVKQSYLTGRTQTMISGLFLSLALIFGGVWLARSKKIGRSSQMVAGATVMAMVGISVSVALANARPPLYTRITSNIFSQGMQAERSAYGSIKIEIVDEGSSDVIKLKVPIEKKSNLMQE
ncbi:MAG: hypothetical protein R2747_23890 [Pyrinomonadaceae bacterium]